MKINKNSSYVLIHLLAGCTNSAELKHRMTNIDVRSIQRSLARLLEIGIVSKSGPINDPEYRIEYAVLLNIDTPTNLLEDVSRPDTGFNSNLLSYLEKHAADLSGLLPTLSTTKVLNAITRKEAEYLTIELSWKSSALEGNTYTLLDTELLIKEGLKAKNRTDFETQMILNHKNTIEFIIDNQDLFSGNITFATLEHMHKLIGYNLGIDAGVRKRLVKISASNYTPMTNPHQIRESIDRILIIISKQNDPYQKALLALSLVPYLQTFEDGNKRTGRMLSNAITISMIGRGFSLKKVEARDLAMAYLAFYEFNSLKALADILKKELSV
jgi:hypothetical protein